LFCFSGLEAQLLGIVVKKESPELEKQKDDLVLKIAAGKKKLVELEDEILRYELPSSAAVVFGGGFWPLFPAASM